MAKNNNLTDFMVSVANAIRTKKGTSGAINPQNFDSEILSIEGMPSSTKALANVVSGETPTDEITLNNALAVGLTDTPETATFAERTTADGGTIKDTIARIDKVKGNCVKLNQLVNFANKTAATFTTIDGTTIKYDPTNAGYAIDFSGREYLVEGHKYLVAFGHKGGAVTAFNNSIISYYERAETLVWRYNIGTLSTLTTSRPMLGFASQWNATMEYTEIINPMLFDLTAMGMESITSADELAQYFGYSDYASMPYLPYSAETKVLTNSQNSVTSKSRNLLASANDLLNASGWEKNTNGEYFGLIQYLKTYTDLDGGIFRNYIGDGTKVLTFSGKYKCSTNILPYIGFWYSDGTRSSTRYDATEGTFAVTSESGKTITGIRFSFGDSGILTLSDLQIEVGSTATDFCPYFAPDNLPTNAGNLTDSEGNTIFPNGMQSNGSTYDEWDMAKGKVVKRIANDGTILATPLTYNVPPQKAYYKVSQNGKEIANSTELSAPFKADIAYRGMSAEDLINELNG